MTKPTFSVFTPPGPGTITSGGRNPTLADRYLAVPFSLLDARTGWWRDRKAAWLQPAEVWTVAGSGVLTRALQRAWPAARFVAVVVGKQGCDTGRARRIVHPLPFTRPARVLPPFPSAASYDAKAWEYVRAQAEPEALFWNVAG